MRSGKLWVSSVLLVSVLFGSALASQPVPMGSSVVIGIVQDKDNDILNRAVATMRREITDLLGDDYALEFRARLLQPRPDQQTAEAALRDMLADPQLDMVLAAGYVASTVACEMSPIPKPLLAPFALDAFLHGLEPGPRGGSGIPNLVYTANPSIATIQLKVLQQLAPVKRLALVAPPVAFASPEFAERSAPLVADFGVEITLVPLQDTVAATLASLPDGVDAVSALTPTLDRAQVRELADGLKERRLPSFSFIGAPDVESGFLCGTATARKMDRMARRLALNVQRILRGTPCEEIPVDFSLDERLTINMETARAIGVSPRWDLRLEADLIHDQHAAAGAPLELVAVMTEAVRVNLDRQAEAEGVAAGAMEVRRAKANLLPQLDVSARGTMIDEDRAASSFGSAAERTATASASLTQILWSDSARANHTAQGYLQHSREQGLARTELDVALSAALAYLDVLRAATAVRINLDNLRLTQSNLELARTRERIGVAGPAEIYRWESRQSRQRSDLVRANRNIRLAEMELNRILHRNLEAPLALAEVSLEGRYLSLDRAWLDKYVTNPDSFDVLRRWMAGQALSRSPELKALDAALAANSRLATAAGRALYVPTVALFGNYDRTLDKGGAGAEGMKLDPTAFPPEQQGLVEVLGSVFPAAPDDDNWTVGVSFSLPLFEGGALRATRSQARSELAKLQYERDATAERIEQRVLAAAQAAGASFASIRHSRDASVAAQSTLELVTDAYARGATDAVDLLEAQNSALVAELEAANAEYDFLADYFRSERAMGFFTALMGDAEREAQVRNRDSIFGPSAGN